ncbi:MAG: hypothetical protein RBR13_12010, partial [Tenuifilaceae bacterium]|nr:hypothetical protein [Tenuifilaceae bacterium]
MQDRQRVIHEKICFFESCFQAFPCLFFPMHKMYFLRPMSHTGYKTNQILLIRMSGIPADGF